MAHGMWYTFAALAVSTELGQTGFQHHKLPDYQTDLTAYCQNAVHQQHKHGFPPVTNQDAGARNPDSRICLAFSTPACVENLH